MSQPPSGERLLADPASHAGIDYNEMGFELKKEAGELEKITLDQATLAKLHNLKTALEICNENGEVVGFLTPASNTKCPFSEQELDRRSAETQTYSTSEVLGRLEKL